MFRATGDVKAYQAKVEQVRGVLGKMLLRKIGYVYRCHLSGGWAWVPKFSMGATREDRQVRPKSEAGEVKTLRPGAVAGTRTIRRLHILRRPGKC